MNLTSIFKDFLYGNQYVGIEYFSFEKEEKIALLELKKSKEELIITNQNIRKYKEGIFKTFDKNKVNVLVVNTNQVIQKEVDEIESSDNKLLHKVFPNINWEEFYYEIWRLEYKSIICITRKSYIEELLLKLQNEGISITNVSLGNCSISNILHYSNYEILETNLHNIKRKNSDLLISLRDKQSTIYYNINGLNVSNEYILSFSSVLQYFLNNKYISGNIFNLNSDLEDDFFQKQFFRKGVLLSICFLLSILLLNFFVFTNYYDKVQKNNEILTQNSSTKITFSKTKERIDQKEAKLYKIYGIKEEQCSYLINDITKTIPSSILLNELTYQPLEKKIKNNEPILFQKRVIIISGTTINNQEFTNWTESLEKIKQINKVIITHFGRDETLQTTFAIKLLLHEIKQEK